MHGAWKYNEHNKNLQLADESALHSNISVTVDSIHPQFLLLSIDSGSLKKIIPATSVDNKGYDFFIGEPVSHFILEPDYERYSNPANDLFSKENNWWRIKPLQPENLDQLAKRVLDHIDFWKLVFQDAFDRDREFISYNWFSSPLNVSAYGVSLSHYDDIHKIWEQNFYDSAQAHEGFQMMRKCFSKKLVFLQTDNIYEKQLDMLRQLRENFLASK